MSSHASGVRTPEARVDLSPGLSEGNERKPGGKIVCGTHPGGVRGPLPLVIEEIDVPAQHFVNELDRNTWALDAGVFESLKCSAAIKPGFTLKVLVVERHLLLEDLLESRHRRFKK